MDAGRDMFLNFSWFMLLGWYFRVIFLLSINNGKSSSSSVKLRLKY